MTTNTIHPDQLQPGQMVGLYRILESLGTGGFGHTFKAEREGGLFSLKMAVRPASEEREVEGRLAREAAALMTNATHPNLPRLYAVDRWPHPRTGYLYFVTDYVEGETFHNWRARTRPTAGQLVDVVLAVTLAVAELHQRGLLHRDLSGSNILICKEDGAPMFIDLGSVWLPGASTLTEKLPPSLAHTLPPECASFLRRSGSEEGEHFDAGEAGDLYQLGVFLYEALVECHPFDPKKLTAAELLTAIETLVPRPPHYINPAVPESLSRITLRLLEKRPGDRYPSAKALYLALWDASKERKDRAWKKPLTLPASGPAPVSPEELEERKAMQLASDRKAQEAPQTVSPETSPEQAVMERAQELSRVAKAVEETLVDTEATAHSRRRKWMVASTFGGALLVSLLLFVAWQAWVASVVPPFAPPEQGSTPVSSSSVSQAPASSRETPSPAGRTSLTLMLCAMTGLACAATPVKPEPAECPDESWEAQTQKLKLLGISPDLWAVIDINQPTEYEKRYEEAGVYHDGPIVGRITHGALPEGTLLFGRIWTGPGIGIGKQEVAILRYTEAHLPDGRRFPVCIEALNQGSIDWLKGSKPGAVRLPRQMPVYITDTWH